MDKIQSENTQRHSEVDKDITIEEEEYLNKSIELIKTNCVCPIF